MCKRPIFAFLGGIYCTHLQCRKSKRAVYVLSAIYLFRYFFLIAGVLLYALLCGYLPFDDDNITNLYRKIKAGRYTVPEFVSSESSQLISQLLQVDPKRRITIEQLMVHPWLCIYDGKVNSDSE